MLGAQGLLSCHTYCDTGPRFIRSHPKDRHLRPTVGFEPPTQGLSDHYARRSNRDFFCDLMKCYQCKLIQFQIEFNWVLHVDLNILYHMISCSNKQAFMQACYIVIVLSVKSVSLSVTKSCAHFDDETADPRDLKLCTIHYYH